LKSIRISVLAGAAVAVALVVLFLVVEYVANQRIKAEAESALNAMSLPLLEAGDPSPLFGNLDEGVDLVSPNMGFIRRFLPLVTLDPWQGEIEVPLFFANEEPSAALTTRAHYAGGTADLRARMVFRDGQWRIRDYEVIPGPAAQ
jgi:hypothetical protein